MADEIDEPLQEKLGGSTAHGTEAPETTTPETTPAPGYL